MSVHVLRRAAIGLIVAAISVHAGVAQEGYRTPPDAITKILDSPAPQVAAVSADRRWLLITTSDVPETTIAEIAEPTLFLAGRRFRTQPVHRIDMEGVRSASLKPVDGGAEIRPHKRLQSTKTRRAARRRVADRTRLRG